MAVPKSGQLFTEISYLDGVIQEITVHSGGIKSLSCGQLADHTMMIRLRSDDGQPKLAVFLPKRLAVELHQWLDEMLSHQDIIAEKVD